MNRTDDDDELISEVLKVIALKFPNHWYQATLLRHFAYIGGSDAIRKLMLSEAWEVAQEYDLNIYGEKATLAEAVLKEYFDVWHFIYQLITVLTIDLDDIWPNEGVYDPDKLCQFNVSFLVPNLVKSLNLESEKVDHLKMQLRELIRVILSAIYMVAKSDIEFIEKAEEHNIQEFQNNYPLRFFAENIPDDIDNNEAVYRSRVMVVKNLRRLLKVGPGGITSDQTKPFEDIIMHLWPPELFDEVYALLDQRINYQISDDLYKTLKQGLFEKAAKLAASDDTHVHLT